MIHVCVPVLNRYDLLRNLLVSLQSSTVRPDRVYIVDNGMKKARLDMALLESPSPCTVFRPEETLGLAVAWNWFINNVSDDRFVVNDDIQFAPDSLAKMVERPECFVSCGFGFSCFLIRDECVRRVGMFDEDISPGYAYFEDRDYYARMQQEGIVDYVVNCDIGHVHSATPAAFTTSEMREHHRRFVIAQENFLRKWGKLPADLERQYA